MDDSTTTTTDLGTSREAPVDQVLYTPEQAEERLNLNALWLKRQAKVGRIPCWRMGKLYRFTEEHIAEIARIGSKKATAEAGRASGRRSR
ncbi:hypothetical protein [Nonomuraea sp. NPDC049758]|uniref:hypothetical protein n=1 Tax=Nonomuraea sp. NPDC049758 TaxID=3154360 RepID=UPI0034301FD3